MSNILPIFQRFRMSKRLYKYLSVFWSLRRGSAMNIKNTNPCLLELAFSWGEAGKNKYANEWNTQLCQLQRTVGRPGGEEWRVLRGGLMEKGTCEWVVTGFPRVLSPQVNQGSSGEFWVKWHDRTSVGEDPSGCSVESGQGGAGWGSHLLSLPRLDAMLVVAVVGGDSHLDVWRSSCPYLVWGWM